MIAYLAEVDAETACDAGMLAAFPVEVVHGKCGNQERGCGERRRQHKIKCRTRHSRERRNRGPDDVVDCRGVPFCITTAFS